MLRFCLLSLALVASANAACTSHFGNTCLKKSEVGSFSFLVVGGDPCFPYSGGYYCFTAPTSLQSCTCNADCGCSTGAPPPPPPPKCENAGKPTSFDCDKTKWCDASYEDSNKNPHTMCKYCGVADTCGTSCQYGLTQAEKDQVLKKHNDLRRRVAKGLETLGVGGGQPTASNMKKMKWNDELAVIAQRWTDQCVGGHDKNRNTKTFPYVGQNYAWTASSVLNFDKELDKMVQMWYDEVKDFPPANVPAFSSNGATGVIGHYTQVVWADSVEVGCGFIQYQKTAGGMYEKTLVCNYGPGGNYLNAPVYKTGAPGSACATNEDGLCA